MKTLTIRNLDDDVVAALKAQARRNNRSLEAEVRELIERATDPSRERATVGELMRLADKIADMSPDTPQTDSVQILRELRDEQR